MPDNVKNPINAQNPSATVNVKDLEAIKKKMRAAYEEGGKAWEEASKLEGPDRGIDYNYDTDTIKICTGWHADADGNIVRD